ncbi:MAG: hypothetical protein J6T27_01615 [Alphaproteobacteria bacterium]|nr:hypothetical protein [Alphaproteobacteria bacterium]
MKKILGLFCVFCLCGVIAPAFAAETCQFTDDRPTITQIVKAGSLIDTSVPRLANTIPIVGIRGALGVERAMLKDVIDRKDLFCLGDAYHCFQCDRHNAKRLYECYNTDAVVVSTNDGVFIRKCNFVRHLGNDAKSKLAYFLPFWREHQLAQEFIADLDGIGEWTNWEEIPLCSGSKIIAETETEGIDSAVVGGSPRAEGVWVTRHNGCLKVDCKSGYTYNSNLKKCEKEVKPNPNPDPTPDSERKTCRERRVNMGTDAIACCDTGKEADWTGGQCVCKDKSKEFRIVNGRGKCVAKDVPGQKTCREQHATEGTRRMACCDVEDAGTGYWENGDCYCNDKNAEFKVNNFIGQCIAPNVQPTKDCPHDAHPSSDNKTCVCNDDKNMEYDGSKCICKDRNKEVKDGKCEYSEAYIAILISGLDSKYDTLSTTIGGFEKNVWRDADGNFNTARLASDSIAGVVLGTVGGIVTANLVKKAQVKQGFEDIGCYIGGQSVADYGDEFNVGR